MTLAASIISDSSVVFLSTSDFAEAVTYHPHQGMGESAPSSRSISAVVIRQQLSVFAEDGDTITPPFEVHVANSSTVGINTDELDLGGDQIEFPPRDGKTAERRTITDLISHDPGMLVLLCQ